MKKIISLMIVVMLLISCLPTALAIGGGLGATSATVAPGETVTISVTINAQQIATYEAWYSYDPALTFVSCTQGNATASVFNPAAGANFANVENVDVNGTIYTLTFVAPQEEGTYAVSIEGYMADVDENIVYAASGSVTVKAPEKPSTEATEPSTEATEPSTEPSAPSTEPSAPSTEPAGPSDDEPKTGDITPQIVMAVASVIAVAAAAMFVFKRKAA